MSIKRDIYLLSKKIDVLIDYTYGTDLIPFEFRVVDYDMPDGVTATAYIVGKSKLRKKVNCTVSKRIITYRPEKGIFEEGFNDLQICITNGTRELYSFMCKVKCHYSYRDETGDEEDEPVAAFQLSNFDYMFQNNLRLDSIVNLATLMSEEVTMNHGFDGSTELVSDVTAFNFARLVESEGLYFNCTNLTSIGEKKLMNSKNVASLCEGCTALRYAGPFELDNCLNASKMFYQCSKLSEVEVKNTGKVEDMSSMFALCSSLANPPVLDMASCKNATYMYDRCEAMTTIGDINMPACEDASYMFNRCSALKSVENVVSPACKNFASAFFGCTSLNDVAGIDTSAATNLNGIFWGCASLEEVDFVDFRNATNITSAFRECTKLRKVSNVLAPKAATVNYLFNKCTSLEEVLNVDFSGMKRTDGTAYNYWLTNVTTLKRLTFAPQCTYVKTFSIKNMQFTRETLVELFNSLPTNPYAETITVTGNPGAAELTEADIAIATSKNFTITI